MISGVVYLLRIFKMFHGLMNNPVHCAGRTYTFWILNSVARKISY